MRGRSGSFGISPASEGKTQLTYDERATTPIPADGQFIYDEQVRISDQSGKLLANVPYHITDESGNVYKGVTDAQGCCERVFTDNEQSLKIFIGVPALEKW